MTLTKMLFKSGVLLTTITLTGCAIHQTVRPVTQLQSAQICVINNSTVRETFQSALAHALEQKGFEVRRLAQDAALNSCQLVVTYDAHWRWDLAMYMAYADIKIYSDTKPVGEAIYDSTRGAGNMGKFIDADKKIAELVTQLFPGGPPH